MAKDSSGYYPLRFVLRVHSLQTGRLAMFIEQIALRVTSAKPPARPLRVWLRGSPLEYRTNPHTAVYRGQRQGETIAAVYAGTTVPQGHVQLAPGESDELTVELASQEVVDLTFRLEVLYTNAEDATVRRLALPYDLRTIFSDSLNWQPYRLVDGRLVQA